MNNIRKMAERFDYQTLPEDLRQKVDDFYKNKAIQDVKAEVKRRGVKKLQERTEMTLLRALKMRKLENVYLTSNNLTFAGPYLIQGYDLDNPIERAAFNKAPTIARKYAGSGRKMPIREPEDEKLPTSFYDEVLAEAKTIGAPMRYPERREAIEKLIQGVTDYQKNKINELDKTDVEAVAKLIQILSKGYKEYEYTDESGQTKQGRGSSITGVAAYRRKNPGSKLQTAVTGKVKPGSKAAKRRKSFCARSAGQMKKFPKAAKNPNSRLRQARKRWKC